MTTFKTKAGWHCSWSQCGLAVGCFWLWLVLPAPARCAELPSPTEALTSFTVADGLELSVAVAEPEVAQPVYLTFDERGRLWVVQYLQYPFPAGLKVVGHDEYWRVKYDHFPPPAPPHHVPGADKITIFEDKTGQGRFGKVRDFVSGLNICTAALPGRGGVWVLNPPYLLFYPDANRDDVPDGDPTVCLEGFGLEDLHAVANSLTWGPDGWLYGCQGSTCTAAIRRPGINEPAVAFKGQCIWRYQPHTRRFELFAEGGYNNFGIAFDPSYELFTGSNGGIIGVHYVEHGYYRKIWGKHGPLTNPYTLGWFEGMRDQSSGAKLSQAMVFYDADALPQEYLDKLLVARVLQRRIDLCALSPDGSTFSAREVRAILSSSDERFRPVDMKIGPDGAIYIADWNEDNVTWNVTAEGKGLQKNTGRIYRLASRDAPRFKPFDLAALSTTALAGKLESPNIWQRHTALRLLWDRADTNAAGAFASRARDGLSPRNLEAFWATMACKGFDVSFAAAALRQLDPRIRKWAVRVIGDENLLNSEIREHLVSMAAHEPDNHVRSQLACTARSLPVPAALAVVENLLQRSEDSGDPHIPLLLWWALESQLKVNPDAVLDWLREPRVWQGRIFQNTIAPRLGERYTLGRSSAELEICARLLELAPSTQAVSQVISGMVRGLAGNRVEALPAPLASQLAKLKATHGQEPQFLLLSLRLGQRDAVQAAARFITMTGVPERHRLEFVRLLGELGSPEVVEPAIALLQNGPTSALRSGALEALQGFAEPRLGDIIAGSLASLQPELKRKAFTILASRPSWSKALLSGLGHKGASVREVPLEVVAALRASHDPEVRDMAERIWGKSQTPSETKQRRVQELTQRLAETKGNPETGQALFTLLCANCHTLFGTGGQIGPDLTGIDRQNRAYLLRSIIAPSEVILPEFQGVQVVLKSAGNEDARVITGFIENQNANTVWLKDSAGTRVVLAREKMDRIDPMQVSIMPEGLLDPLTDHQVADLFAYLQSRSSP